MPLEEPEQVGTDAAGMRINDYCEYCYHDGRFPEPHITREQMIAKVADLLARIEEMPPTEAQETADRTIPISNIGITCTSPESVGKTDRAPKSAHRGNLVHSRTTTVLAWSPVRRLLRRTAPRCRSASCGTRGEARYFGRCSAEEQRVRGARRGLPHRGGRLRRQ